MTYSALVSIFCPDHTGLVASITGNLFDSGANLAATTFSVLGSGAEFTAICELPDDISMTDIETNLVEIEGLDKAKISVTPFTLDADQSETGTITHHISVSGGDQPGLIARLCEVFVEFKANIVRMNAERIPTSGQYQYCIQFSVCLSVNAADKCLATIANTAQGMQLDCTWEKC
jgi:glycine cleavage system transcriptional repressor